MKLLKCLGVLMFWMALCVFIALAGGSEWGTKSLGWMLSVGVIIAAFHLFIVHEDL